MSYATTARLRKAQNHKALSGAVAILALLASLSLQVVVPSAPAASAQALDSSATNSAYALDRHLSSGQPAAGLGVEAFTGPIVQEFYVPMPEAQIRLAFLRLASNTGTEFESVISVVVPVAGTVVVLDHWEDGYEVDLNHPLQATTRIWGDGDNSNGIAPGFANDPNGLPAGQVLATRNLVQLPRSGAILLDGRDRVGATQAVVMTRSAWATTPGSVLADATEVPSTADYGTSFVMPIGEDVIFPTPLTASMFELVSLFVQAAENGTQVQIDTDGAGPATPVTVRLNRGESYLVNGGMSKGATVTASKPVQVQLLTGDIGANYESRWFTIPPTDVWTSEYFSPVGTAADGDDTYVFLHNPNAAPITVNYTTRVDSGSFQILAKDTYRFLMPQNSGAQFVSPGVEPFFAVGTVGARPTQNNVHDWGFSLVPALNLTTELVTGWGPGTSDLSANGNPVWITAVRPTRLYVDYNGDHSGPNTDPNGNRYDIHIDLAALEIMRIYEPDKDQTGLRVYTLDGTLITGAWGQDPATAGPGNPFLDVGTTIPSFPIPVLRKTVTLKTDNAPSGLSVGDVMEYTITLQNKGLIALAAVTISDQLPVGMTYVPASATRDGISLPDNTVPPALTGFPIDESGVAVPILLRGQETRIKYLITIAQAGPLRNAASTNLPGVETELTITVPGASPTPCSITFTNAVGVETDYQPGDGIYVTCTDPDTNTDPATPQSLSVVVRNTSNGDLETLALMETGANTGIFRNTAALPSSTSAGGLVEDGALLAVAGHTISVSYTDPVNGETCSDTAVFATASAFKQLYLSDPSQALDRVDPVATGDTSTSQTAVLGTGAATITVDATSSVSALFTPVLVATTTANGNSNSFSFTHNAGTGGQNRLLLVGISLDSSATINSVTYGGVSMSAVGTRANGANASVAIYRLVNPPTGSSTVAVTLSAAANTVIGAATFTGVHQTTPLGTFASATGSSTTPSVTVNSTTTGDLVFDTVATRGTTSLAPGANQTEHWDVTRGNIRGGASTEAAGGNITMSWSAGSAAWAIGAVPIKAATGTTSLDLTHTTGSGADRLMLVGISKEDDTGTSSFQVDSITYAGQALSRVVQNTSSEAEGEIWRLVNPPSGLATLTVNMSGAEYIDEAVVGVTTFTGVDQTTPLRSNTSATGSSASASVNVTSAAGDLVFDTLALDDSRSATVGANQTQRWNLASRAATGDGVTGAASTEPGAASVTMSWTVGSDSWVVCAVSIRPASVPAVPATFTQTPTFCRDFTLPAGGQITAKSYYTLMTGAIGPAITANLKYGANTFFTDTSATSGSDGNGTYLEWSGILAGAVTIPSGSAIVLDVTSNLAAGNSFKLDYDSAAKPSKITLPTTTVISVDSLAVYDAPYPGGAVVTTPINGQILYVRAVVSDPFGAYDITGLQVAIDGPGVDGDIALTSASVVASDACSKTYEYQWRTGVTEGAYTVAVTAKEGYEDTVTDQKSTTVTLGQLDLGTPSTTEFTNGNNGPGTDTYTGNQDVCVRVTDIDQNTNPAVAETVTAVITSSSGDTETVTLTETGPNTGVFTTCIPASTTGGGGSNNGTLNAPLGSALTVTYVDPNDPTDVSSDTATVPPPVGTPGVAVVKTLLSPADGQIAIGETAQFRLRVTNTGNTILNTVQVVDTFPSASLSYVSASPTPDSVGAGSLTWNNVGPLSAGLSVDILVEFTGLAAANPATNSVNVTTGGGPTASDSEPVVVTQSGVSVAKTRLIPASGALNLGDNQTFRIVVQNTGVTAIATLPLEDTFSAACWQYVSAIPAPDTVFAGGLLWNDITGAGSLAAGNSLTVDVTLKAVGGCDPANNTAGVNYALDQHGDAVPPAESSVGVSTRAAAISGFVYADGGNLAFGSDDNPLYGVVVRLYTDPNGDGDPSDGELMDITTTNSAGYYEFLNRGLGNYVVVQEDLPGYFSLNDVQGLPRDNRVAVNVVEPTVYPNNNFLDTNQSLDLGDHPESYGTRITTGAIGAVHILHADIGNDGKPETLNGVPAVWLGATVDAETDGQPTIDATGDDNTGIDDEDGIVARPSWTTGGKLQFQVQVSSSAAASGLYLGVWIDWNKSGVFETAGFSSGGEMYKVAVDTGTNILALDAPGGFDGDPALELRLRLYVGDPGTPSPTGPVSNGEVEDHVYSLSPLAVTLANFEAVQVDDYVLVTWETNSELNNRGFNLWRGTAPSGPDTRLNDALIPSQSQGNPGGFTYTWEDRAGLVLGTTYYYWVEDVDISGGTTRQGPVSVTLGNPLAVVLAGFDATPIGDGVQVTWETVSEVNNTGFNLYRSSAADGVDRALLAFVPSQSPGSTAGASYSVTDAAVTAGQTYWYLLEDVDLNGVTTLHGPVSITASAPTAVTLASLKATPANSVVTPALGGLAVLAVVGGAALRRRHR